MVNFKWKRDKLHAKPEEITPVVEEKQIVKPAPVVKAATVVKEQTPESVEIEYYEIQPDAPVDVDLFIDADASFENIAPTHFENSQTGLKYDENNSSCVTQDTSPDKEIIDTQVSDTFAIMQKESQTSFLESQRDIVKTISKETCSANDNTEYKDIQKVESTASKLKDDFSHEDKNVVDLPYDEEAEAEAYIRYLERKLKEEVTRKELRMWAKQRQLQNLRDQELRQEPESSDDEESDTILSEQTDSWEESQCCGMAV